MLSYRGKSGVDRRVRVTDRRLARIVRSCRDLPGQRLFQYVDGDAVHPVTSTDVNTYVREVTGGPFTAKDYRTWAASLGAAMLFCMIERPRRRLGHVAVAINADAIRVEMLRAIEPIVARYLDIGTRRARAIA